MRRWSRLLVLAALALWSGACKQSDSILYVTVFSDDHGIEPTEFSVDVTVDSVMTTHNITVKPRTDGEAFSVPVSFTIELDRSHTGPVVITVEAEEPDANGTLDPIAAGTTTMQHIEIGGVTNLTVVLMALPPPGTPDGGTDGGGGSGGASGSSGGSGAGGGGGAGGAAGQGGASGTGGAGGMGGGGGAMGLDGATD